jgi:ssDNA-binding Zn-finger/Zn-ribbon topoisomerase 1
MSKETLQKALDNIVKVCKVKTELIKRQKIGKPVDVLKGCPACNGKLRVQVIAYGRKFVMRASCTECEFRMME